MHAHHPLMRAAAVGLLACGLWLPRAQAQTAADAPAVRELLASARYWAERHRPDIARQMMRKLLAIHPGHPEALVALGLKAPPSESTGPVRPRVPQPRPQVAPRKVPTAASKAPAQAGPQASIAPPASHSVASQQSHAEHAKPGLEAEPAPSEHARVTTASLPPEDGVAAGLAEVWLALDQRQTQEGLRLGQALSARYPARPDVTRALALALRDSGARGLARQQLVLARQQAQAPDTPSSLQWVARESQRTLQDLDDRRQPTWNTGMTWVHKPGDPGVSQMDIQAQSLRVRQPWADHGHWFAQLDRVRLDAGLADNLVRAQTRGTALALDFVADNGESLVTLDENAMWLRTSSSGWQRLPRPNTHSPQEITREEP